MPRMFLSVVAIALWATSATYGQSLGDVARENREKQSEDASAAPPKVITNKDLPKDPDANQGSPEKQPGTDVAASSQAADRMAQRAAEQWKRQILAQKNKMSILQARIDTLNASIHSVGGTVQSEGPYNRYQARQLERLAQMQQRLDEQKVKLEQMQEAARQAGMHTAVYDP